MSYKKSAALAGLGSSLAIAIAGLAEFFGIQNVLFYAIAVFIVVFFMTDPLVAWLRKKARRPAPLDSSPSI